MEDKALRTQISRLCRLTDCFLWAAYSRSWPQEWPSDWRGEQGRVIFPKKHDDKPGVVRYSEQEARFSFVDAIHQSPFRYSAETPHQTKGWMDLSLYTPDNSDRPICNLEFKCQAANKADFDDDMRKLLCEEAWGLGFHLFADDAINLDGFTEELCKSILKVKEDYPEDLRSPRLIVHLCFLSQGFSLEKEISLIPS